MTTFLILAAVLTLLSFLLSDASWNNVLSGARNDLVFQGRHQAYGAYPLRREQHRTVMLAFGAATGLLFAGLALPKLFSAGSVVVPEIPMAPEGTIFDIFDDDRKEIKTRTETTPTRSNDGTPVAVDSVKTPIDTTSQAEPTGPKGDGPPVDSTANGGGKGKMNMVVDSLPVKPEIKDWAQFKPEFPGGDKALQNFWGHNVDFEPWMLGGKPELLVYVQFVIDVNGHVIQAEMVRSGGAELDREVLLAVRRMPDWKPGRMGEEEVAVRLKQPIRLKVR